MCSQCNLYNHNSVGFLLLLLMWIVLPQLLCTASPVGLTKYFCHTLQKQISLHEQETEEKLSDCHYSACNLKTPQSEDEFIRSTDSSPPALAMPTPAKNLPLSELCKAHGCTMKASHWWQEGERHPKKPPLNPA